MIITNIPIEIIAMFNVLLLRYGIRKISHNFRKGIRTVLTPASDDSPMFVEIHFRDNEIKKIIGNYQEIEKALRILQNELDLI